LSENQYDPKIHRDGKQEARHEPGLAAEPRADRHEHRAHEAE